jgi:hypothetical protein
MKRALRVGKIIVGVALAGFLLACSSDNMERAASEAGGMSGDSGSGACAQVNCAALDEAACKAHPVTEATDGCVPRYGARWPDEIGPDLIYAGCAPGCCKSNGHCLGGQDAFVCAANEAGACWTLTAPPAPAGWTLLGNDDDCSTVDECNE